MKIKLLILPLLLSFASANAQWTSDTTMNTSVRDSSILSPLMASMNDGSTYICWFEYGPTSNLDLHMQLLNPDGYKQWAPEGIIVSNLPQNSAIFRYDMKVDNDENAIVAFQDERTGTLQIIAYKIDKNGISIWGNGVTLIDSLSTGGLAPVVGITGHNDVVIAWNADSGSSKWIAAHRISASGVVQWNNPFRMKDTVGTLKYSRPRLLPWGSDGIQMMFVEENGSFPGVTSTLYTQKINDAGIAFYTSPIKVSTKTIPYFIFPEAIPDTSGGFYVSFNSSNPVNTSLNDVYVQHVDSSGNLWSTTGTEAANSTINHKLSSGACFIRSSGEFWVLLQVLDGGQGSSGVSVQKFDASGNVLLGPDALSIIAIDPVYYLPYTINDVLDGVIFSCSYGPFGNQHIIAMKVDYSGNISWPGMMTGLCSVNSNKDDVSSGLFVNDNLVFVWQDDRFGSGVFAQNINAAGVTGVLTGTSDTDIMIQSSLFPNPSVSPTIYFSSRNDGEKLITVSDLRGKEILKKKIYPNENSFSLSNLKNIAAGIYLISIRSEKNSEILRWIK